MKSRAAGPPENKGVPHFAESKKGILATCQGGIYETMGDCARIDFPGRFSGLDCVSTAQGASYSVRTLPLPDNNAGDVSMDYITFDPGTNSVWVPGGNTGAVDVVDVATGKVRQIPGFATKEVEGRNGKRILGPSGVSIGEGVVYIGNRADSSVCAFDSRTLAPGACAHFDSPTDGVVYVAPTKEVWVTTPGDKSIRVVDSKTMQQKAKLNLRGQSRGLCGGRQARPLLYQHGR